MHTRTNEPTNQHAYASLEMVIHRYSGYMEEAQSLGIHLIEHNVTGAGRACTITGRLDQAFSSPLAFHHKPASEQLHFLCHE